MRDGAGAKNNADKIIDLNGTKKTGGTGIKQLRENIAESKLSYEIMDDAAQAFLKSKIMDNIHKYFYIICFAGYMREAAAAARESIEADKKADVALPASGKCSIPAKDLKLPSSFVDFMTKNDSLRAMVDSGKGNLQWERDIPPAALSNLEGLANKDFKGNLGQIIHEIYQTAHQMFSDMPQGDHKKRAKYRFASKTLMRILPTGVKPEVEGLLRKEKSPLISMRFLESAPGLNPNKLIYISSKLSLLYILLDFFKVKGAQVKLPYYVIMRKIFLFSL